MCKNPVWVCLLAAVSLAQRGPTFRSNVEIVAASCAVVDARGVPVEGLTREDFRVFDDDVARPIQYLWTDAGEPITLGVIVDASESQREQVAEHRRTAVEVLQQILRPGDRSFVIQVDGDVRMPADWTGSPEALAKQMESPGSLFGEPCPTESSARPSACGSSPIWNAIYDAALLKLRAVPGTKALLVLTDGFDSGSTHTWKDAVDAAHRADAAVYAIQYASAFGRSYAPDLYRLVAETGGASFPKPAGDYERIVSRIEADLRHRYALGFPPEQLTGRVRHDLRIEVTRPDLTVRARKAYFLEPR